MSHEPGRRWQRLADTVAQISPEDMRQQRSAAKRLKRELDRLIDTADEHLAQSTTGNSSFPRPHGTDWAWRPQAWRSVLHVPGLSSAPNQSQLGDDVQLFHDSPASELTLRQLKNTRKQDLAPYGLQLDVFRFDGSFLSLAVNLPAQAIHNLSSKHLLRVEPIIEVEAPLEIFTRLNIRHGPNTDQITQKLPLHDETVRVDFEIPEARINEKRVEKIWLDIIFNAPQMNQVILRDLTFARFRRAEL